MSCRFRVFCHWLSNHSYFSNAILVCIMVSSALLAAENPLKSDTKTNQVSGHIVQCNNVCDFRYVKRVPISTGSGLLRLLFHHSFHYRNIFENCVSWFCTP